MQFLINGRTSHGVTHAPIYLNCIDNRRWTREHDRPAGRNLRRSPAGRPRVSRKTRAGAGARAPDRREEQCAPPPPLPLSPAPDGLGGGATEGSGAREKGRGPPDRSERGAGVPARMPATVGQRPKGAPSHGQNILKSRPVPRACPRGASGGGVRNPRPSAPKS